MEILGTAGIAVGVTERAIKLLKQLKELSGDAESVPEEVLRLVLLDTEYNLTVLEVIKPQKGIAPDDERFFAYAQQLRLDSLLALLLEWRKIESQFGGLFGSLRGAKSWKRISGRVGDDDLLGVARFIVVRGHALRALETIDPAVRKKLFLHKRLRNIRDALRVVRDVLRSKSLLEHLTHGRTTWTPPPRDS